MHRVAFYLLIILLSCSVTAEAGMAGQEPAKEAGDLGSLTDWIMIGIGIAGLGGVIYQIHAAADQMRRDHARRKVEATLAAVRHSNQLLLKCDQALRNNAAVKNAIADDSTTEALDLLNALDEMEFLAVGFKSRAHHLGTGLMMLGTWYCDMVDQLRPLIMAQREQKNRPTLYTEAQWLEERFKNLAKGAIQNGVYTSELLINLDA